jgi:hypothetical protein
LSAVALAEVDTPTRFLRSFREASEEAFFPPVWDQAKAKDVATELHLVFDILQKFSFSSHKRHSIQDERMSDVLWSENKPMIAFLTD